MKTREQIKYGLYRCTCPVPHSCNTCPYHQSPDNFPQCSIALCKDTLEMINEIEKDRNLLLGHIIRKIKTEINPYGKPFEGTAYEFGKMLMDYLESIKTVEIPYDMKWNPDCEDCRPEGIDECIECCKRDEAE